MLLLALLIQILIYWLLLLANEYLGSLVAAIIGGISLAVWLLSYVVEWISPSRVTKRYYQLMLAAWLAPLLAILSFLLLRGGQISWLHNF